MSDKLNSALKYVELGWKIFPLSGGTKIPLKGSRGVDDATSDMEQIKKWFTDNDYNIGVAADSVGFMLDVDVKKGKLGPQSLAALESTYGRLPTTVYQTTPSGGLQYLFSLPVGITLGCTQDKLGNGLDTKGVGGYFVAPPSYIDKRQFDYDYEGPYEWIAEQGPFELPIAEAPSWLIDLCKYNNGKLVPAMPLSETISEGSRNVVLTSLAGTMRRRGASQESITAALLVENNRCSPPLGDAEIIGIAKSIARYDPQVNKSFAPNNDEELPESLITKPLSLTEFLAQDIKPIEYFIAGFLPKKGRLMISAATNSGKSIFAQNISLAMTTGATKFINQTVSQGAVLYIDCEMGNSALKDRFTIMTAKVAASAKNLFVKHLSDFDLLNPIHQKQLSAWIEELKVDAVIIDPVGSAWAGDENDKQAVSFVTRFLNTLIDTFGVSIVIVHHWKKATKDIKSGGGMAAGSYKWAAWVDNHFTLSGDINSLTVSCEKARHGSRTKPFLIKLNAETCWFEFLTNFEVKYTTDTLVSLFDQMGKSEVSKQEFEAFCKENKGPSARKISDLVSASNVIKKRGGNGRPVFYYREEKQIESEYLETAEESWEE